MKVEQAEIGLLVDYVITGERMTISGAVEYFDDQPCVICKVGRKGIPRMVALSALEPAHIPEQKKGV